MHRPSIDIDTPAQKTLKLLDKLMRGLEVRAAQQLKQGLASHGWHALTRTRSRRASDAHLCMPALCVVAMVAQVSPREAMELRDTILHAGADLRQPLNLSEQLMRNSQTVLDNEVTQSLIQLLSLKRPTKVRRAFRASPRSEHWQAYSSA